MKLATFRWFGLVSGIGLAACGGDSGTAPTPTPPATAQPAPATTASALGAPTPLTPAPGSAILQNDPATGCDLQYPSWGQGFRIEFSWTAPPLPAAIDRYELFATKVGADYPIVNKSVRDTSYLEVSCGFVVDRNLEGWEWKVRAVDVDGVAWPWSPAVPFRFLPCRIGGGAACSA